MNALAIVRNLLDSEEIDVGDFVKGALGFESFMERQPEENNPMPGRKLYVWDRHFSGDVAVLFLKVTHFTPEFHSSHSNSAYIEMDYHDIGFGLPPIRYSFYVYEVAPKMLETIKGLHQVIAKVTAIAKRLADKKGQGTQAQQFRRAEEAWEATRQVFIATLRKHSTVVSAKIAKR